MTFLSKDVRDYLAAGVEIANAFGERIFPDGMPQGAAYPAIVISDLSNSPEYSLAGEVGTHTSVITIDCWTDGKGGRERVNRLGEMVRNRLSGYRGALGDGVYCNGARMIRNNSLAAEPLPGSDQHRRRASMDFEIIHTAAVPDFA
jgi:hypothetical protein